MLFDEELIKNLGDDALTPQDRKYLLEKYFPKGKPASWKTNLKSQWESKKQQEMVERRWGYYLGDNPAPTDGNFRISHAELVRRAKAYPPTTRGQSVTDFTKWLYALYRRAPTAYELNHGKEVEKQVSFRVGRILSSDKWELVFQDPLDGKAVPKKISALTLNGVPLQGVPDVVFRERDTGRILIVERKASNSVVPDDGWPNLKAQLWAYGQADEWRSAPQILLIGEVWADNIYGLHISKILRWNLSDEKFQQENGDLFQIYAGHAS